MIHNTNSPNNFEKVLLSVAAARKARRKNSPGNGPQWEQSRTDKYTVIFGVSFDADNSRTILHDAIEFAQAKARGEFCITASTARTSRTYCMGRVTSETIERESVTIDAEFDEYDS